MSPMPELTVVIVNYNTRELLRACLASLISQPTPLEVIVVDNASSDGSADMVRQDFPQVMLLAQAVNTWFCRGNNIGIEASGCEYVLLLNPDTVVHEDALGLMLDFLRAHPDYAGVTAQLYYPDGRGIQPTCAERIRLANLFADYTPLGWMRPRWRASLARQRYAGWGRDTDRDVQAVPGSCTMMRRADIWLDESLWLYFPEEDLAMRHADRPFRFLASAKIAHHEKSATQSWSATRIFFRDMMLFTRKYWGWGWMLALWLATRPLYSAMWMKHQITGRAGRA